MSNVKSNIWKFYVINLLHRRNYYPIVAIFFLTLPGALEHQIGYYSIAGYIASFLLEIPSGYVSDKLGHKNAVLIGLLLLLLTSVFFAIGTSLIFFILASICLSGGFAFLSGSREALIHETLIDLGREKDFSKILSKMSAIGSFASIFLIVLIPLTTKINIRLPFLIYIVTDIITFILALTLKSPKITFEISQKKNFFNVIGDFKKSKLLYVSLFEGLIFATMFASGNYTTVHLNNLGLPLIFIGVTMALSRFFWFATSTLFSKLSRELTLKEILIMDMLYYIPFFAAMFFLKNLYVAIVLVAFAGGYKFSRMFLIKSHIVSDYVKDKRYKATIISIHSQISSLLQILFIIISTLIVTRNIVLVYATFSFILLIALPLLFFKITLNKN